MRPPFSFWKPVGGLPLDENPTGLWLGPYAGSPWIPTASAGSSAANGNLITGLTLVAPGVGAAVNGIAPADYGLAGTPQTLKSQANFASTLITTAGLTIITLCQSGPMTTAVSPGTNWFDPAPLVDSGGYIGISETSTGIRGWYYSGGINVLGPVALPGGAAAGQWYMTALRLAGTTFKFRVNNGADLPVTAGNLNALVGATFYAGGNFGGGNPRKGQDMAKVIYNYAVTDAQLARWYSGFKAVFPSMALP